MVTVILLQPIGYLCLNKVDIPGFNDIMLGTSCTTVSKYSDNVLFPKFYSLATLHSITSKCFSFTSLHPFFTLHRECYRTL